MFIFWFTTHCSISRREGYHVLTPLHEYTAQHAQGQGKLSLFYTAVVAQQHLPPVRQLTQNYS